jgi:hypothetical protein
MKNNFLSIVKIVIDRVLIALTIFIGVVPVSIYFLESRACGIPPISMCGLVSVAVSFPVIYILDLFPQEVFVFFGTFLSGYLIPIVAGVLYAGVFYCLIKLVKKIFSK